MSLFLLASLFLASCGEQTELEQPIIPNGETVEVSKEIQVNVLPMQTVGGGATRAASGKPEKGEAIGVTYTGDATTRVQTGSDNMTAGEATLNKAYIVQFNGTDPTSTAAYVSGDIKSQLNSGSPITCSFAMAAGKKNRVYVVANPATVPTKNMTLAAFEAPVTFAPSTSLPGTGLPMSAVQDIGVGDVVDIFQLRSVLAKLKFTTSAGTLKLKGLPNGYSFYTQAPGDNAVRPTGTTYSNTGVTLTSGTTYYVPENLSGRVQISHHAARSAFAAPTNSMFVEIAANSTTYGVYLGDGSASDFNFVGGYSYDIKATLYGTDGNDMRVGNVSSVTDLNASGETANCYVATNPNTWYMFNNTMMGNGKATPANGAANSSDIIPSRLNPANADVLWESVNTADAPTAGTVVNNNIYLLKDRFLFRSGSTAGNAVIAARDASNTILWSWHIWRTEGVPAGRALKAITDGAGFTVPALTLMDRNLGALRATPNSSLTSEQDNGLYYQWGRKDPFQTQGSITSAAGGSGITPADAVKNPTTFYTGSDWTTCNNNLWGCPLTGTVTISGDKFNTNAGNKSIYDPCPVGWKVMPSFAFANIIMDNSPWDGEYRGRDFKDITTSASAVFFLPASGQRNKNDGRLDYVGSFGNYWASSPSVTSANNGSKLYFDSNIAFPTDSGARVFGNNVRCVQE